MVQPDYDFFATNRPPSLDPAVLPGGPKPPVVNRFGSTETEPPAAPSAEPSLFGPPPAAPAPFPVAPASGYQPGRVNQFGTPVDVEAAPVGPYAAPGVAAAAIESPGLVSTWDPAARAGGRAAARQAQQQAVPTARPGTILAAGILSIISGVLTLFASITAWILLSSVSGMIAESGGRISGGATTLANTLIFAALVVGVISLASGVGTVMGNRTAVRVLRILVIVGAALTALSLIGGMTLKGLVDAALYAVMIWLLWNSKASEWLAAG